MKSYSIFYLRNPGFGSSWKVGISKKGAVWSRLGTYQNAFGPEYKENWKYIWIGSRKQIELLEEKMKEHFDDRIEGGDAGYSEWVKNTSEEELLEAVRFYREEFFIKVHDVPEELHTFTSDKIAALNVYAETL